MRTAQFSFLVVFDELAMQTMQYEPVSTSLASVGAPRLRKAADISNALHKFL